MGLVVGDFYIRVVLKDYYTSNKNTVEWLRVKVSQNQEPDGISTFVNVAEEQFFTADKALYVSKPFNYVDDPQELVVYRYYADGSLRVEHRLNCIDKNENQLYFPFIYEGSDVQSFGSSSFTKIGIWHTFYSNPS